MPKPVYWVSPVPDLDDFGNAIHDTFIDGRTPRGIWGLMVPEAHKQFGCGLGLGCGQKYVKQADGKWLKVEG